MSDDDLEDSFSKLREEVKKVKDRPIHKNQSIDPLERKLKASFKKKKNQKVSERKCNTLPEDENEWDEDDWERYYNI